VARRIEQLRASGTLYTDVEIAYELVGFTTTAYLWLTIAPSPGPAAPAGTARCTVTARHQTCRVVEAVK